MPDFDPAEYIKKQPKPAFDPNKYLESNGIQKKNGLPIDSGNGSVISGQPSPTSQAQTSLDDELFAEFNPHKKNPFITQEKTTSTPAKESFASSLGHSALAGIDMLGGMISNIPSGLLDLGLKAGALSQPGMAAMGVDAEMLGKDIEASTGLPEKYNPLSPNNALATMYAERAQKNQDLATKGYDGGIFQALKDGKYADAGKLAAMGVVESIPVTLGLIASRGAGVGEMATLGGIFGVGTAGQTYTQLKKDYPNMDKNMLYLNSVITGMSEAGTELLGTNEIYNQAQKLFLRGSKKEAETVLRKGFKGYMDAAFKKLFVGVAALDEGSTEAVNQLVKNATDKWSGVKPDVDYTDGVMDAFIVGVGAGATTATPFTILDKISKGRLKKNQQLADKLVQEVDNPDISPEAREVLMNKLHQTNEALNTDHQTASEEAANLTKKQTDKATEITSKIDELSTVIDDPNVSDAVKSAIKPEVDILNKQLDEVIKNPEVNQELIDELEKDLESLKMPEETVPEPTAKPKFEATEYFDDATNTIKVKEKPKAKEDTDDVPYVDMETYFKANKVLTDSGKESAIKRKDNEVEGKKQIIGIKKYLAGEISAKELLAPGNGEFGDERYGFNFNTKLSTERYDEYAKPYVDAYKPLLDNQKTKDSTPTAIGGFKVTGESEPAPGGERVFTVDDNGTERYLTIDGKELKVNTNEQPVEITATADVVQPEVTKEPAPVNSQEVAKVDDSLEEGSTIQWDRYGNEDSSEWTVGKKTKTRGGQDAVELSREEVEEGTNNPPSVVTHIVALSDLNNVKEAINEEVKTEKTKDNTKLIKKAVDDVIAKMVSDVDLADNIINSDDQNANISAESKIDHFISEKVLELVKDKSNPEGLGNEFMQVVKANKKSIANNVVVKIKNKADESKLEQDGKEQPEADTETVIAQGEVTATEAEAIEPESEQASQTIEKIDAALEDIEDQLKLLGHYDSSGDTMKDLRENGSRTPEKKFKADLTKFSKRLAALLGYQHDTDRKGKIEYANTNIAPIGGDGHIILWKPGTNIGVYISIPAEADWGNDSDNDFGNDTLDVQDSFMWRTTDRDNKYTGHSNRWDNTNISAGELATKIRQAVDSKVKQRSESSKPTISEIAKESPNVHIVKPAGPKVIINKVSAVDTEIEDAFKDFAKSLGKTLGSSGLSSESIEKGIKLVGLYTKKGIYKFADMVDDAYQRFGDAVKDIIPGLKAAYTSFYSQSEDDIADQLTDPKEVRKFDFDEYLNNKENGTETDGTLPDSVRDNKGTVDGTEQSGGTTTDVQGKQTEEVPGEDRGAGVQDAGRSDESGNEGGRSSGSDQRGSTGTKSGSGESRESGKPKTTTGDNGRSRSLSPDSPDANMIIPEGMNVVPDGPVAKVAANMNAMLLLNKLEAEDRNPTPAEKVQLVKFVGWGGLASYLEGNTYDSLSKGIFSGEPVRVGYSSQTFSPQGKLETEGKTFDQIVDEFRRQYQEAIQNYNISRYAPSEATDANGKVSLDFARKQVIANMLTEEEMNSAKVSTENAHYTEGQVIRSMWDLAKHLGFDGGTVLESSAGIGHFFGMMPKDIADNSTGIGVELDSLTGRMMKKLYPQNQTYIRGFQDVNLSNNSVDLAIGNVPFASTGRVYDSRNKDIQKFSLHNYFIAKNLRLLKPGGIAILVTSKATMDNASSAKARIWFASLTGGNSDLIGAIRLPNNAFSKNAGTQVTTDILVFRKRTSDIADTEPFFTTQNIRSEMVTNRQNQIEKADIDINEYYIKHPDNMIGKMMFAKEAGSGGLYSEFDPTLKADEGTDVMARVKELFSQMPKDVYKAEKTTEQKNEKIFSNEKSGKIFIDKNGEVFVSEGEEAVPAKLQFKTHKDIVRDYIPLRDAIYPLLEAELRKDATDDDIEAKRKALNKVYDAFAKKHKNVSSHATWLFPLDIDFPLIAALENVTTKTHFSESGKLIRNIEVSKGDMLKQRVNYPISIPKKADNYEDAVRISVSYKGYISNDYIAELMSSDPETAKAMMLKENLAFENPVTGILEPNDLYLSGQVRSKLEQAQEAAKENPAYQRNVDALEDVQPKLIPAGGIDFKMGVSYLPVSIYKKFVEDTLGIDARINYIEQVGQWDISALSGERDARNTQSYAVQGTTGMSILADLMSNRSTTIYYPPDKDNRRVINEAATSAASDMQEKINTEFQRYVKKNEEYRDILEKEYNKIFNNYVEPKVSLPSFKYYPGAVNTIELRIHQIKGVLRAISGNTLFAHDVGTGKTFTIITSAMEMRRLGTARKPMIVVKNSTLNDFASSFKKLYPTAKILVLSKDEINAKNRKLFFGRIPSSDWDAIIIPQSQFDMIPDRPERVMGYIQEKIAELQEILNQTDDVFLKKRLEKEVQALNEQMDLLLLSDSDKKEIKEAGEKASKDESSRSGKSKAKKEGERIARLTAAAKKITDRKTDNILDFDDMGVDALIVDESHSYKRLGFQTNIHKVKGIDVAASKKAVSAYLKTQAVMDKTGGKNVIFATGTPVTNTMAELWTNMRYLIPDTIRAMGITTFDQFQKTFTEISDSIEQNAGGNFESVQRLSTFYNIPELIKTFRSFADVVTTDDIPEFKADPENAPPELKTGKPQTVILKMTDTLRNVMLDIKNSYDEYKAMGGQEKRENSYRPLLLYYIGKVAPIDPRLINPRLPDDPGSKSNAAVGEILRLYKEYDQYKATQMVFSDSIKSSDAEKIREILGIPRGGPEFNLYEDIKQKLIEGGIPANEIAILTDSKYDKDEAKKKLFDMVNEGTIRVLIGSTDKMGVGVNAQQRMIGLHHLDAPGRPDMFTQRNGRILRQGNMFAKLKIAVEILAYGMEGTRDATAFQRLEKKQGFITQLFKGSVDERRMDDVAAEEQENIDDFFAELGASLSGNKDALKLVAVKRDLRKEENRQYSHQQRMYDAENSLRNQTRALPNVENKVLIADKVVETVKKEFPDGKITEVTIDGNVYTEHLAEELQKHLVDPLSKKADENKTTGQATSIFKIGNVEFSILVANAGYGLFSSKEGANNSLFIRSVPLNIGTEFDDKVHFGMQHRRIDSDTANGMLHIIRNEITAAEEKPARMRKLLETTQRNIKQLEEDMKEKFDSTKLDKLSRERNRLENKILGTGTFSSKKLDEESYYVLNNETEEEVKGQDGETVYYKTQAEADAEAKRLNDESKGDADETDPDDDGPDGPVDPDSNIQGALDFLESAKIKGGKTYIFIVPIPPAVWNGAIDVLKAALRAGNSAQQALQKAIKHLRDNGAQFEHEQKFREVFDARPSIVKYESVTNPGAQRVTSKNAETERKMMDYGFGEPAPRRGATDRELSEHADRALANGFDVHDLMDRIERGDIVQGWERVVLTKFQAAREAELLTLDKEIESNQNNSAEQFTRISDKRDAVLNDMLRAYQAGQMQGTVASNALRSIQVKVAKDMSLAGMMVKMRKANLGKALTQEEIDQITRNYADIQNLNKELEAKTKQLEKENLRLIAQAEIKKRISEKKSQRRSVTLSELQIEKESIIDDWRRDLRKVREQNLSSTLPYLNELLVSVPHVIKLANNLMDQVIARHGTINIEAIISEIHEEFIEDIPELTERDILDIIIGKYNPKKETKTELQKAKIELRKQANLLINIEDAERGLLNAKQHNRETASNTVKKLRAQLDDITRDEKDLKQSKDRINKKLADIDRRLKEEDFSKPEKRTKASDKELEALEDRLIKKQFEYVKALTKKALKNRTDPQKYKDWAIEVLSIPRGLMSTLDFSAVFRQGLVMTVAHPLLAVGAGKEMFLQAVNKKRFDRWLHRLQESDEFVIMQKSGLYISDLHNVVLSAREEEFMSNLAEKVPIIGSSFKIGGVKIPGLNLVKGSQRAYVSYLNKLRADVFQQMIGVLEIDGHTFANSPDLYKATANFVNNATGRGSLGDINNSKGTGTGQSQLQKAAPLLNSFFFSPRLIASRLTLLNPIYYARIPAPLRRMIWGDMAKFVGLAAVILFLFSLDDDLEVEWDPRSSDFGKIKYGNTRWDILGGFSQYIRYATQITLEERMNKRGKIVPIDKKVFPFDSPVDVGINAFRSKLAPLPAMWWNLKSGYDMVGNPYGYGDIYKSFIPLAVQDINGAVEEQGPKAILTAGLPAMFGVGVQTYGNDK